MIPRLKIVVPALAALLLSLEISPSGLAAGPPTACNSSYNVYTQSPQFLSACGDKVFPRVSIKSLPYGWKGHVYAVNGQEVTFYEPPPGFDATVAPDDELKMYALPTRPADPVKRQEWETQMKRLRLGAPGPYLVGSHIASRTGPPSIDATSYDDSQTWSGYVAFTQTLYVNGTWDEPTFPSSQPCTNGVLSTWDGIGGISTPYIVQAGTIAHAPGWIDHEFFYEMYSQAQEALHIPTTPSAAAGTAMNVTISASLGNLVDTYTFYMYNAGNGHGADWSATQGNQCRDINSGEFILERPLVNKALAPLYKFNSPVVWEHAWVNSQNEPLTSYNNENLSMYDQSTATRLAHPGSLYKNNWQFNEYWDASVC